MTEQVDKWVNALRRVLWFWLRYIMCWWSIATEQTAERIWTKILHQQKRWNKSTVSKIFIFHHYSSSPQCSLMFQIWHMDVQRSTKYIRTRKMRKCPINMNHEDLCSSNGDFMSSLEYFNEIKKPKKALHPSCSFFYFILPSSLAGILSVN